MDIKSYFLGASPAVFRQMEPGAALSPESAGDGAGVIWHDLLLPESDSAFEGTAGDASTGKLHSFLSGLNIPEDIITACTASIRFPEVEPFAGGVFVRYPGRASWDAEKAFYILFICIENVLISIRRTESPLLSRAAQLLRGGSRVEEQSSQGLLAFLMDSSSDINTQFYMSARAAVEEMADLVDDVPESVNVDDLIPLRRAVGKLYSHFEDQFYCMSLLQTFQGTALSFAQLRGVMRDVLDSQNHVTRSQQQLEARMRDLHNDCTLYLQRKTDHRLRVLTVLTTICMPLSVIAGVYGMNFKHMPELEAPYGYYAVLGLMAALVGGLLLFFYKRGWFK